MGIPDEVYSALDTATHENGYPHEYGRSPKDIVVEIHDYSGLSRFDIDFPGHLEAAERAVLKWRRDNPPPK